MEVWPDGQGGPGLAPYLSDVIASIGNDPGSITGFVVTLFVFLVLCAVSLTGGGLAIWRDARGWAGRTGGAFLVLVSAGCWTMAAFAGVFGTVAILDARADHREKLTSVRRSCEASTYIKARKAEMDRCVEQGLLD